MSCKAPGKANRKGISTNQFFKMFPDNASAEAWLIQARWPKEMACPKCGSLRVKDGQKHKSQPFRCMDCRGRFSVKTGTPMQDSNLGYRDWLYAIYLLTTNLKSVASMKIHRELGITQKAAWHLAHRVRKGWGGESQAEFESGRILWGQAPCLSQGVRPWRSWAKPPLLPSRTAPRKKFGRKLF